MSSPAATFYPTSPAEALKAAYVGQSIRDVPTPAVVIDVAAVRRNCERMLRACDRLKLSWRAHVKTHKVRCRATRVQTPSRADRQPRQDRRSSWRGYRSEPRSPGPSTLSSRPWPRPTFFCPP